VVRELCVVRVRASSSLEADAARLPAGHLAVVTSVGLHVLLDRYELGPRGQEHVGFEALVIAREAGGSLTYPARGEYD
jgi:hypothetical protein